jgi:energy-coupling factor transporter ATP-binding protein EcfA2
VAATLATTEVSGAGTPGSFPLSCRELSFTYDEGVSVVEALRSVDLAVAAGARVALLGPTGSGKSTLLQLLRGLLAPDGGEVLLDGLTRREPGYEALQRRIGLVFQMPELQLFAATCRDDVAFGPRQLGWTGGEVAEAVERALQAVGLPADRFGARHPYSLSGGEQRRLALAGVLAMRPSVLLLDEPFVSLDPGSRRELESILRALAAEGMGLVLATHDVDRAYALCDERILLDAGQVVEAGPWSFGAGGEEVLDRHRLKVPFLVELWRRLGRSPAEAPRTIAEAAEVLA